MKHRFITAAGFEEHDVPAELTERWQAQASRVATLLLVPTGAIALAVLWVLGGTIISGLLAAIISVFAVPVGGRVREIFYCWAAGHIEARALQRFRRLGRWA